MAWRMGFLGSEWGKPSGKDRCESLKRVVGRGVRDELVGRGTRVLLWSLEWKRGK